MIFGEHSLHITTFLAIIFLVSIVVEAVTEILTSSELTDPLRGKLKKWAYPIDNPPIDTYFQKFKVWADKLVSCGYCSSVWVAGFFGIWAPKFNFGNQFINWLIIVFILHRLATWVHVVYELIKKGRVKTFDVELLIRMVNVDSVEGSVLDENLGDNNGSIRKSTFEESAETESEHIGPR